MAKYHVTDEGRVLPCGATNQRCPYMSREDERHFDNVKDAAAKANDMLTKRYNTFVSVRKVKRDKSAPFNKMNIGSVSRFSLDNNKFPKTKMTTLGSNFSEFENFTSKSEYSKN